MTDRIQIQIRKNNQPVVNVAVFKNEKSVEFAFNPEHFQLCNLEGVHILPQLKKALTLHIKPKDIRKKARYDYYLILFTSCDKQKVEEAKKAYSVGNSVHFEILETGGDIYFDDQLLHQNKRYNLLAGPFPSEREARHYSKSFGQLNHCRVHRRLIEQGEGTIEVFDKDFDYYGEAVNGIRLLPKDPAAYFALKHIEIYHYRDTKPLFENLYYQGALTIGLDEHNRLMGINTVDAEQYLRGVLLSEVGDEIPLQFAKAMSIVIRSQLFARLGQVHADEPFEFCNSGHCLRYYGKKSEDKNIEQAIDETNGQVLGTEDAIYDGFFSYSCGGHTEIPSGVWEADECPYVPAKPDARQKDAFRLDLRQEKDVKEWINNRPEVYCKVKPDTAHLLKDAADAFRWEIYYNRNELEEILKEKTGEDVGMIYEIIPLKRGRSGRIKELEILGSLKNVKVKGELNIRSALSEGFLNSSCFYVKTDNDDDGVPLNFSLIGVGKGHGIGLCKVGAATMAEAGQNAETILKHYFENCKIKRIY